MIDRMLDFLTGRKAPALSRAQPDDLQLAVAALLIEAARMDDQFDLDGARDHRARADRALRPQRRMRCIR